MYSLLLNISIQHGPINFCRFSGNSFVAINLCTQNTTFVFPRCLRKSLCRHKTFLIWVLLSIIISFSIIITFFCLRPNFFYSFTFLMRVLLSNIISFGLIITTFYLCPNFFIPLFFTKLGIMG